MIKVEKIRSKAGFTKEQLSDLAVQLLEALNKKECIAEIEKMLFIDFDGNFQKFDKAITNDKNMGAMFEIYASGYEFITVTVKGTRCKYNLINNIANIFDMLNKLGIKVYSDVKVENPMFEKVKKACFTDEVLTTSDAYSDGNFAISKDYVGNVSEFEKTKDINFKNSLNSFLTDKLIKVENYNRVDNIRIKTIKGNSKYTVFYKNKENYNIFNKRYVDLFKDCELYLSDDKIKLFAVKDGVLVGLIMAVSNEYVKWDNFELLPDVKNTTDDVILNKDDVIKGIKNIVKYPIVVYQENKMPVEVKESVAKEVNHPIDIEHKNAVTGHIYKGLNAEALTQALNDNNYQLAEWVASGQTKKLNKQIKKGAKGVTIRIYYEDDSGRSFCKLETIYNVAELENIQKIEMTTDYKNMIERLKAV